MSIVLFLYGFFLIVAFRYGKGLTGKTYLFWVGIALGLSLMFLATALALEYPIAWWLSLSLLGALSCYQLFYLIRYRFFPARVGLFINTLVLVGLLILNSADLFN